MLQQLVENPVGLFPLTAHRGAELLLEAILQHRGLHHRRAGDRLLKNLDHLFPIEVAAVVRHAAVEPGIELPQALHDLRPVLAGERAKELFAVIDEEHAYGLPVDFLMPAIVPGFQGAATGVQRLSCTEPLNTYTSSRVLQRHNPGRSFWSTTLELYEFWRNN